MSSITKESIIQYIVDRRNIWDIDKALAVNATKDIPSSNIKKYSAMHYKTVYLIIKAKLDTIRDPVIKIAYLDCLDMNYGDLGSEKTNAAIDIAGYLLSGGYLGESFITQEQDIVTLISTAIILLVFQAIKAINLSTRRWNFYQMVIKQLKSEISD